MRTTCSNTVYSFICFRLSSSLGLINTKKSFQVCSGSRSRFRSRFQVLVLGSGSRPTSRSRLQFQVEESRFRSKCRVAIRNPGSGPRFGFRSKCQVQVSGPGPNPRSRFQFQHPGSGPSSRFRPGCRSIIQVELQVHRLVPCFSSQASVCSSLVSVPMLRSVGRFRVPVFGFHCSREAGARQKPFSAVQVQFTGISSQIPSRT